MRRKAMTRSDAEALALGALVFISEDPARLARFLRETGITPDDLRATAGETETLLAVLGYLLGDESMLLVHAAGAGIDPMDLQKAHVLLGGEAGGG